MSLSWDDKRRERPKEFTDYEYCWQEFSNAIIKQACKDYKEGMGKRRQEVINFVRSEYFRKICDINPEYLIKKLQEIPMRKVSVKAQ